MADHDQHRDAAADTGGPDGDTTVTEAGDEVVGAPGTGPAGIRTEGTTQVDASSGEGGGEDDAARTG